LNYSFAQSLFIGKIGHLRKDIGCGKAIYSLFVVSHETKWSGVILTALRYRFVPYYQLVWAHEMRPKNGQISSAPTEFIGRCLLALNQSPHYSRSFAQRCIQLRPLVWRQFTQELKEIFKLTH